MKRRLARWIPHSMKPPLKEGYHLLIDVIEKLKGRDSMTPPRSMIFVGAGDFGLIGQELKRYFSALANVRH